MDTWSCFEGSMRYFQDTEKDRERESIIAAFGPLQSVVPKTRYPWISAKLQAEEVAIHPSRIIQGLIDLTEVAVTAALLDSGLEFSKSSSSDGQWCVRLNFIQTGHTCVQIGESLRAQCRSTLLSTLSFWIVHIKQVYGCIWIVFFYFFSNGDWGLAIFSLSLCLASCRTTDNTIRSCRLWFSFCRSGMAFECVWASWWL